MKLRQRLMLIGGALFAGLLLIIVLNSFGVDRDETFTDLHRPEIVGESQSNAP